MTRPHTASRLLVLGLLALLGSKPEPKPERAIPAQPSFRLLLSAGLEDGPDVARDHGLIIAGSVPALSGWITEGRGSAQATLAALRSDPRVRGASHDLPFTVSGACCGRPVETIDPGAFDEASERIDAAFGPVRALGAANTLVAVLDTGVDRTHPDLADALEPGRSFVEDAPWDEDSNGHGTAMASLVGGRPRVTGQGLSGVAPGVRILPVRVADRSGRARLGDVVSGIVYAVDRGADVILLSLGTRLPAPILAGAIAYAEERGVVVVAAAGNRNTNVELLPAADSRVISVGAVDDDGALAFSTALAPATDLLAPGVEALAALPRESYAHVTGSSVAAARIAGLVALIRSGRDLSPIQVRALLRGARKPLFTSPADLARTYRAGVVDPMALARRLTNPGGGTTLILPEVFPARARPGEPLVCTVRVENTGLVLAPAKPVAVTLGDHQVAIVDAPALAPGESVELRVRAVMPQTKASQSTLALSFDGTTSPVRCEVDPCRRGDARDLSLGIARVRTTADGGLDVSASVFGRSQRPESARAVLSLEGETLAERETRLLALGEREELTFHLSPQDLARLPGGVRTLKLSLGERDDDDGANDVAWVDVDLPGEAVTSDAPLRTQYQQSGRLNIIADAPWRLAPGRDYVPLLIYVPEKGDLDPNTWAELDRVTVTSSPSPSSGGTVIYDDDQDKGRTDAYPGTVLLDEMGGAPIQGGAPDLRLFGHQPLSTCGRYAILRLPRAAFNVGSTQVEDRYISVTVSWTNRRRFLRFFHRTRTGQTKKVLRVRFAAEPRPTLPGEGRYYDTHVHTIAEWYRSTSINPTSPRKAWGGPLPMLNESAYAVGMIDSVNSSRDRVITSDHNMYYNAGDSSRDRPLYGPTSNTASGGLSEWDRMGQLYGRTRAEEITFKAKTEVASFLNLPVGAHVLTYRAQHVDGPWHGGSDFARLLGDPSPDLPLAEVMRTLTKSNPAANGRAAIFAAHPQGETNYWEEEHFETAFERDPVKRDDRAVLASGDGFLTKGLQVWNGHFGRHALPTNKIDFENLNPWVDPTFQQGDPNWDTELSRGLEAYHRDLSGLLNYELAAKPGVRFPRKVFVTAGSDAHGDFNMTEDRLATISAFQSTFTVDTSAFGGALTYAVGEGQPAATADERTFDAVMSGNAVITDGLLVTFSVDAEERFDGNTLRWHDAHPAHEDRDGRIGGGGRFDGLGTALVPRGSENVRLGYRSLSTPEWGAVRSIAIYRTSVGDPNPTVAKTTGGLGLEPRGRLTVGVNGQELSEPLNPAEEGTCRTPTLLQLGAFSASNPLSLTPDDSRCLTNPVWLVPYDATVRIDSTQTDVSGNGSIPAGALTVELRFDMSMTASPYRVEVQALDANGNSSGGASPPLDALTSLGWSDNGSIRDGVYTLTNSRALPLNLDRYPTAADVTFVLYFRDAPQDAHGNSLNRIAATFTTPGIGKGGSIQPSLALFGGTAGAAPGSTASPSTASSSASSGRSSGCSLGSCPQPATPFALLALLALLVVSRPGSDLSGYSDLRRRVV